MSPSSPASTATGRDARLISGPEFVGRDPEVAELRWALSRPPAVVLLEGEAGIGKSRLVAELLAGLPAELRPAPVAVCPPFRESLTLGPIVDALREATDDVRSLRLSPLAGSLRPMFPEWADTLPPSPEPLDDATAARHRLFRALAELLTSLGVGVLAVEDVHWADEVTLEFLLFLVSRQQRPSLLITYRPEDIPDGSLLLRLSSRVPAGTTGHRLTVTPLDVHATAGMVSSMLGGKHVSTRFATFLHERTDGVPLAVEEVIRLMHDRADLARRDGEWVRRQLDDIDVPPTIRDAVLERAGRLSVPAREVLEAAAVLADPADEATVAAVAGLPSDQARGGLSDALGSGLLAENERGLLTFRHVLNCWAIYEAISPPRRRALHLRAGKALRGRTPLPVAQLARQFREAGETASWARYAEQAADLAVASGDHLSATGLIHDLLAKADLPASTVVRLVTKMPFASFTGPIVELIGALRRVLDAGIDEPEVAAEARFQLGRLLTLVDDHDAARAELQRVVPRLEHDPVLAAKAMLHLGWPRDAVWPAQRHLYWLRRAMAATEMMPPADRLRLLVDGATALLMLGSHAGWETANSIPDDAVADQERWEIARGHTNFSDLAVRWGHYEEARRRLALAEQLSNSHQYLRYHGILQGTKLHLELFTGDWGGLADRAEALLTDAEHRMPTIRLEATLVAAHLQIAAGEYEPAEQRMRHVVEESRQLGIVDFCMEPAAALARLLLVDGRVADALAVTDGPLGVVTAKGIWLWATDLAPVRVSALLAAGRVDEARELVTEFREGLAGLDAPAPLAGLATSEAVLAHGTGEPAADRFAAAARAWRRLPRPYAALLTEEAQATCLFAEGDADAGCAVLSQVFQGLSELGARGDAARVRHALRERGVDVKLPWWGGRRGYGDQLSPRELDVVRLLVGGRTNRQIAQELFVSPKTVARHLNSAMRKLKVTSRTALAVRVMENDPR